MLESTAPKETLNRYAPGRPIRSGEATRNVNRDPGGIRFVWPAGTAAMTSRPRTRGVTKFSVTRDAGRASPSTSGIPLVLAIVTHMLARRAAASARSLRATTAYGPVRAVNVRRHVSHESAAIEPLVMSVNDASTTIGTSRRPLTLRRLSR